MGKSETPRQLEFIYPQHPPGCLLLALYCRTRGLTPDEMPIDLILHTPGGLVASEQIAEALKKHPSKVTVFVPHYAMSGGTMISLAADEIMLDENAVLGLVNPQLGQFPAASIIEVTKIKKVEDISDNTLIMADIAHKAIRQVRHFIKQILSSK